MLDLGAKRRLTGAVVLVVLAVVFVPMLLDDEALQEPVPEEELRMPEPPALERGRQAEIFPGIQDVGTPAVPAPVAAQPEPVVASEPEPESEPEPLPTSAPSPVPAPEAQAKPAPAEAAAKPKPAGGRSEQKPKTQAPAAPKPVPKGLTSWVVQVAALSTAEAAQKLERDLRGKGFHAFVEKVQGPNRTLWRVRVGPEVERGRADALATDVKKRTGLSAFVQKYRDG